LLGSVVSFVVPGRLPAQTSFLHPLADTAALAVASYATYSPSACLAAVTRVGATARKSDSRGAHSWDQLFLESDTVLAVERQTATRCAGRYDLRTAAPYELTDLARLFWFMDDTARTERAITQRLASDATDSAKAVTYRQLLLRFLLSRQRDPALIARRVLPGLDSLTSLNGRTVRLEAHAALAHAFAASRRPDALDSVQSEIAAAMGSFASLPRIVQTAMVDTIGPLFQLGTTEATERGDTAWANTLLRFARQSLSRIEDGAAYVHRTEEVVRYFGMEAPPIHAHFVHGAGAGASPSGWPRRGHWTLISPLPQDGALGGFYRHIRAVAGDALDIVFVAATRGSWPPRGPLQPAEESALMYDYLAKKWDIPGILLVETRTFHLAPDGRRIDESTLTPDLYSGTGVLIDPEGTIRAMVQPSTLVRFDQLLTTLMQSPAGVPRHGSATTAPHEKTSPQEDSL
jgi:hypothetical protein